MTHPPTMVFYVNSSSQGQDGAGGADSRSGSVPGQGPVTGSGVMQAHLAHAVPLAQTAEQPPVQAVHPVPPVQATPPVVRPDLAHRDFPSLWQYYCRSNYRDYFHLMQVFGVSERTARKWMGGETGCNGRHVATAFSQHPDQVAELLMIAAE